MASVISRSQSTTSNGTRQREFMNNVNNSVDCVFPIYEQMAKTIHLPQIFYYLVIVINMVQYYAQSLWPFSIYKYDFSTNIGIFARYFIKIVFLFDPQDPYKVPLVGILVPVAVSVITAAIIILEIIHYKSTLGFIPSLLYVVRFLIEIIVPLFAFPTLTISAKFLAGALSRDYDLIYILYAVLVLFMSLFLFFIHRVDYLLFSIAPYLQRSPLTAIGYQTPALIMLLFYAFQFVSAFVEILPKWSSIVVAIVHAIVFIILLRQLRYLPFLTFSTNVIYSVILTTVICTDIVQAIQGIYNIVDGLPFYCLPVFVIASSIAFHIVYKRMKKKAEKALKFHEGENVENAFREKCQIFDDLYLDINPKKYLFYLQAAIDSHSACIIPDGALFRYAFEKYQDFEIYRYIITFGCLLPGFNRSMSLAFKHFFDKKNMNFYERFLTYTVMRIKVLRQSSVSSQFSESIITVRQETKKCRDIIRGFIVNTPDYVSFFHSFYKTIQSTNNHWIEFTTHFPNSSKAYDEYGDFLVNVMTDFRAATVQKHKTALIEDGHRLHKDWAFRSFIHWWPFYLKRSIVDMRGNFMEAKRRKAGSAVSTQSSHSHHTSTSTLTSVEQLLEIAPEEEELYAKSLFSQHRLRLAYQRALEGRVSRYSSTFKICAVLSAVISIVCLVIVDIIFGNYFLTRASQITEVKDINFARYYLSTARFATFLYYAEETNSFEMGEEFNKIISADPQGEHYLSFDGDLVTQALYYANTGEDSFNAFIDLLVTDAINGQDIYSSANVLLQQMIDVYYCTGNPSSALPKPVSTSLKALYSFISIETKKMFIYPTISSWPNEIAFCTIINNIESMSNAFETYINKAVENAKSIARSNKQFIEMFEIIFPVALAIVNILFISVSLGLYYFDLKDVLKVFHDIPSQIKDSITESITKMDNDDENATATLPPTCIFCELFSLAIIITLVSPLILFGCYYYAQEINGNIESITDWMDIGGARGPVLSEAIEHLTLAFLFKSGTFPCVDPAKEFSAAEALADKLTEYHSITTEGNDDVLPCINFDDRLDSLHFDKECEPNSSATSNHERYRCVSLSMDVAYVKTFISDVIAQKDTITRIDTDKMLDIYHISNAHMYTKLFQISERLDELGTLYESKFSNFCVILMSVGIICEFIICIIHIVIGIRFDKMYETGLVLMRRISPTMLVQNREIMDLIMNKHKKGNTEAMTFSQNIIFSSTDGVLFLNKNGIIEMVNNSINDILGYVPDQILGQNVALIFNESSGQKVTQQLTMMKNNEAKDIFDDHLECLSDNTMVLQCHVTILGLTNQGQSEISTFVMFIRDESQLLKKQEIAEKAKQQSEDLLFQILPRDIVFKLNQGENDITFTVPSATVMFIDIVRFSDYAANLTPQQIMGNLSLIFDSFDKHLTDYPLITKIKLIGDVYMCASGLFMKEDGNPEEHAEQMTHFSLDCLQEIDSINVALESMLAVRIGINTGGPIIGGILGTDKPVFDIIGDAINVASRLQSTDIPGKVQISQSTYDLVHNADFIIEKRGEVYLKGKGNQMTYLVSPVNIFNMTTNTITSSMCLSSVTKQ